jgi:hypothetical protein
VIDGTPGVPRALIHVKNEPHSSSWTVSKQDKAVPLEGWSGPEDFTKLRFPDFMITAQDGGKVVNPTHRPHLPPGNTPGTHLC